MNDPISEAPFDITVEVLTQAEYEERLRSEAREAAAKSVRRIEREGAQRLAELKTKYAREFGAVLASARRTTRRMTSGFSIAFLVGAASLLASVVDVPELAPDIALDESRQVEVASLQVAVSGAHAESELAIETPDAPPAVSAPRARPVARPKPRPKASAPAELCTGDPYDPLNFCL